MTPNTTWDLSAGFVELSPHTLPFPSVAVRIMEMGLGDYIPLTSLTNRACEFISRRSSHYKDVIKVVKDFLRVSGNFIDDSKEPWMPMTDWLEASGRFVELIRVHFQGPLGDISLREPLALAFEAHFTHIRLRMSTQPGLALAYDIRIWRTCITKKFSPAFFQEKLWNAMVVEYTLNFAAKRCDTKGYPLPLPAGVPSPYPVQAIAPGPSHSAPSSGPRYSSAPSRSPSVRYVRGSSTARTTPEDSRCFLCGRRDHTARRCPGSPLYLHNADGRYVDPSGAGLCFKFQHQRLST